MKIQILSLEVSTKQSKANKPYQNVEVAFKNFDANKVESKNITQYSKVFKAVVESKAGQTAEVGVVKNDGGYWEWDTFKRIQMTDDEKAATAAPTKTEGTTGVATFTNKSTYETPEERAKKQVYIVKQSSISNAIAFLKDTGNVSVQDVLSVAQQFTDFVFSDKKVELFDAPNDLPVEVE